MWRSNNIHMQYLQIWASGALNYVNFFAARPYETKRPDVMSSNEIHELKVRISNIFINTNK